MSVPAGVTCRAGCPAPESSGMALETDAEAVVRRWRIRSGVLLGDFLHNLCDGVFIGTAFKVCSPRECDCPPKGCVMS